MNPLFSVRLRRSGSSGRSGSIRTQLIVWNIVALSLLLGALALILRYTVFSFMVGSIDRELDARIQRHLDHLPPPFGMFHGGVPFGRPPDGPFPGGGPPEGFRPPGADRPPPPPPPEDRLYPPRSFDRDGKPLEPGGSAVLWDASAFASALQGKNVPSEIVLENETYRVVSRPIWFQGEIVGVVQAPFPLTEVNRAIGGLNSALLTLIPVGLLFAGWGGAYLTDRVLRRVHRMTQAAEQISAQDFSERLPVSGNDEFSQLAVTFNGLLGRLESAFNQQERLLEQQRRFTADASHELKTPLTIIKGTASMALSGESADSPHRQTFQEIDRASDTMSHLVQDLLLLARSDGGQMGRDPIELLAQEVLERAVSGLARTGGAPISLKVEDAALCIRGNEGELVRVFSNLLENALHYTPPEGRIVVTARQEGARAVITVADTGIGIAPEHLPHLGERFYRVDASRSRPSGGTGLGLSICKSIVEAHGGTLAFVSKPGVGTTVTVTFPIA